MTTTENFIVKFDYTLEALQQIAKESDSIESNDLDLVKEQYKKIVKIRTTIKKQEKEMVDGANEFRTKVFDKRNEYLLITEPVEKKLKEILDLEEARKVMEVRKEQLPGKKQALSALDISVVSDEFILSLDDAQWVGFFQDKVQESQSNASRKDEQKRRDLDQKQREEGIRKEAEECAEREKKELIEKSEADKEKARINAEKDKKDAIAKIENDAREKEAKEKRDREIEEKKEADAKIKLEADKKYQKFLKDNNFNEDTDIVETSNGESKIYRFVAKFKL